MNMEYVKTKAELKSALERKVDTIIVTDPGLAKQVQVVHGASKGALVAVTAGAGLAAVNWWNPAGMAVGVTIGISSGVLLAAVVAIGAALVFVIKSDYLVDTGGNYKIKDKDGVEHTIGGHIKLERNKTQKSKT